MQISPCSKYLRMLETLENKETASSCHYVDEEGWLDSLESNGYAVVQGVLTPSQIQEAR